MLPHLPTRPAPTRALPTRPILARPILTRPILTRLAGLSALALVAGPALAADFDGAYPPPRPEYGAEFERRPPPPVFQAPRFSAGPRFEPPPADECRTFVKRRFDADGEEVVRRVRVCDARPGFGRGPRFGPGHLGGDGYGPPPFPPQEVAPRDLPPRDLPPREVPEGLWGGPRW
ncbi:hypothetical protein [Methylobacterium planeticum]|uniref:Uncharacterized protein n=1 Tax=Methylobacterium planeticum TaxID=2615211 RepID=A0A6N6MYB9_9HYPH|nr:hypothetical protein [Methylobacterium planeticum]KAB1075187.1 hypothetical protein F6X51_04675 [Methylobacterium planeticum]